MQGRRFIVVENAGYVGERDVHEAASYRDARRWLNDHYDEDEHETLRPDICQEWEDEKGTHRSYEC